MKRDKPDGNARELLEQLEREGWVYRRIARGKQMEKGLPDAIIARRGKRRPRTHLLEIKALGGRLSPEQQAFARDWPGCVHVATNSWEAAILLRECDTMGEEK